MALFTPSESPAVVVKEIDLTGGVPNVQSTTGAFVGNFRWGPVEERTLVTNEAGLIETFATPDANNLRNIDFASASQYLRYSNSLQLVRAVTSAAKNARAQKTSEKLTVAISTGDSAGAQTAGQTTLFNYSTALADSIGYGNSPGTGTDISGIERQSIPTITVKNKGAFDATLSALDSNKHTFIARFPGDLGNSLQVQMCPPNFDINTTRVADSGRPFNAWAYKAFFDAPPGNNPSDVAKDGTKSEVHVVVVDKDGKLTGTKNTVLETYPFVSVASNATNPDGSNNFVKDVINERSEYIYMVNFDSDYKAGSGNNSSIKAGLAGTPLTPGTPKVFLDSASISTFSFDSGVNSGTLTSSDLTSAYSLFADKDQVELDFLIAPNHSGERSDQVGIVNDLISKAAARKDCIAVASPNRSDVVGLTNASTITTNITTTADLFTNSSYLVMDGNFLKIYDKHNDVFIQVPAASSTAGIMAATDNERAPWFSPAGARRGLYFGITSIDYTPTKAQRDTLYKAGVNPIANIPGQGTILFGDKTKLNRPGAFDRINVRRLFLVLERAIARAAESVLFEFNDEFTRAEFVNIVEPVLREVKGRRGITDFRVVCDETNNTAAVIDRNEFIASIFIKPARSINYVTLNFVAVRTGVDFEEVVGTV